MGEIGMRIKSVSLVLVISLSIIAIIIIGSALAKGGHAQESGNSTEQQVLREILTEIRQLRVAVQRANLISYRGQMMIERVRAQQQYIVQMTRQLDDLQTEVSNLKVSLPQMQERVKSFEIELENERDPARRSPLDAELKAFKQMVELQVSRQQQLQEREAQLTSQLQTEQGTLNGLVDRLQEIERDMERQVTVGRPSPTNKD